MSKKLYIIKAYQYCIKDSNKKLRKNLLKLLDHVNYIWNYCNANQQKALLKEKQVSKIYPENDLKSKANLTLQGVGGSHKEFPSLYGGKTSKGADMNNKYIFSFLIFLIFNSLAFQAHSQDLMPRLNSSNELSVSSADDKKTINDVISNISVNTKETKEDTSYEESERVGSITESNSNNNILNNINNIIKPNSKLPIIENKDIKDLNSSLEKNKESPEDRKAKIEKIKKNNFTQDDPLNLSLIHTHNANTLNGKTALRFKVMLEGKTSNTIFVDIEDRFIDNNPLQSVINNEEDLAIVPLSDIVNYFKVEELKIFDIPALILNTSDFKKIAESEVGDELLSIINKSNNDIVALAFVSAGKKIILAKDKLENLNKLKDATIGISNKGLTEDFYSIFKPKEIVNKHSNPERYLKLNTINYIETTLEDYEKGDLKKAFNNLIDFDNVYDTNVIIMNKVIYENLNVKFKNDIDFIIENVLNYNLNEIEREERNKKLLLKNQNINIMLINSFEPQFRKNVKEIHLKYLNEINRDLLIKTYNLLNN